MDISDRELIREYRRGRVEALEALVERHKRPLYGYIRSMVRDPGEADDVFQDVWFRAIRRMGFYRHRNFGGWLMRIARNRVVDRVRRRRPMISIDAGGPEDRPMEESLPAAGADPSAAAADADLGKRVAMAVAGLPEAQREVFLLRVHADMPFKKIAALQGVSINTALARMHYAVGRLRPLLKDDYEQLARG